MAQSIRVLITDDHEIVRKGLTVLLATEKDIKVVGEAGNGEEAVEKAATLKPGRRAHGPDDAADGRHRGHP